MSDPVRQLPAPPFLLEVQTERLIDAIQALELVGFELVSKPGHPARYVLRDTEQREQCEHG